MAQVALLWVLGKDCEWLLRAVWQIIRVVNASILAVSAPIVGTTKVKNLEDLVGALCWSWVCSSQNWPYLRLAVVNEKLTEDEMKYLEESYKPMAIIGH